MKRLELFFTFLQVPLDYCLLLLAGASAYGLRHTDFVRSIRPILFTLSWKHFWPILIWVALGWLIIFIISGLYRVNPNRKFARDLAKLITACSTGFAGITIYTFFTLQKFDSRFLVLSGWIIAMLYLALGRLLLRFIKIVLYRWGYGLRRTVIIGNEAVAETLIKSFGSMKRLGNKVVATFPAFNTNITEALLAAKPDEIIFTNPKANEDETLGAIDFASEHHITFKYSADLFATIASNMTVSTIAGIPIIELRRTRLTEWGRIIKRLVDIVGATLLLIVCAPLYLLAALFILAETGRPIIYRNERVGQYNKKFYTLKFRSMYQKDSTGDQFGQSGQAALQKEATLIKRNGSKNGPVYKIKNDPRVTPFGRFLRRWSLDELPQFWNVIKGEMSLVGPRPHQPREVAQYQKHHRVLLSIKPGITGMAQISGRSDLAFEDEAKLDTFYIENWSLYLDCIILVKTPFVVIAKKGAW